MHSGKKLACLALAMATVLPVTLTGCAGNSAKVTYGKASNVTLQVYTWGAKATGVDRIEGKVNDYLASKKAGYTIDWHLINGDDLATKESTMLSTNQPFDLMFTASWMAGGGYVTYGQKGYLRDLKNDLNTADGKAIVSVVGKDFLYGASINGKYYGLPCNKEQGHSFGLLLQTKEMKKLGITSSNVKTFADIAKYFDKVKKDGFTPICAANMDNPFKFLDWDVIAGDGIPGALDPSTGEKTVVDQYTNAKSVAFYKLMKTYHDKGYITSQEASAKDQETLMGSGKYFCGSWSLKPTKYIEESNSQKMDISQIYITPLEKANRDTTGSLLSIPKSSTHPTQAFNFLSKLYTDATLINLMDFGEAGKDYTKASDGRITINDKSDFDVGGHVWTLGDQFKSFVIAPSAKNIWDTYKSFNNKCKALPSLGFTYDYSKVKTQYGAITNVVLNYYKSLFYGTTSNVDSTVAAFRSALRTAGEPAVIADMQKQYTAFLKNKK